MTEAELREEEKLIAYANDGDYYLEGMIDASTGRELAVEVRRCWAVIADVKKIVRRFRALAQECEAEDDPKSAGRAGLYNLFADLISEPLALPDEPAP